jgi:hypothetical protein
LDEIGKAVEHQKELAERRAAWEAERQAETEEQEREQKQSRLENYLRRRGEDWLDHTGQLPPTYMMETWQAEYVAERGAEEELERELRLSRVEDPFA